MGAEDLTERDGERRLVHAQPNQATIASLVRGNGSTKKRDEQRRAVTYVEGNTRRVDEELRSPWPTQRQDSTQTPKSPEPHSSLSEQLRQMPPTSAQAPSSSPDDPFPTSSQQRQELDELDAKDQKLSEVENGMGPATGNIPALNTIFDPHQPKCHVPLPSLRDNLTLPAKKLPEDVEPEPNSALDDFEADFRSFPSSSTAHLAHIECRMAQQPHETTAAGTVQSRTTPALQTPQPSNSSQTSQRRFFTPDAIEELHLAILRQRSRRSAALEEFQRKERQRYKYGLLLARNSNKRRE
ncbi:hypothetical protein IF2G_10703 [Cordyceps javanica]|nr:hypothetical protein IF2G_10703 [Cordyceps javanica]